MKIECPKHGEVEFVGTGDFIGDESPITMYCPACVEEEQPNAECKQCGHRWEAKPRQLTVIPHETDRSKDGKRNIRTDYCPICETENVAGDLADLDKRIKNGECPGPLLWEIA